MADGTRPLSQAELETAVRLFYDVTEIFADHPTEIVSNVLGNQVALIVCLGSNSPESAHALVDAFAGMVKGIIDGNWEGWRARMGFTDIPQGRA